MKKDSSMWKTFVQILLLSAVYFSITTTANGLDPLNNFCRRWYHQSQVKNNILFVDGGIESFSDRSAIQYGIQPNWTGPITTGPNDYVIAINMSASWDWKTNISEVVINKTAAIETGNPPPNVQSGAFFQGPPNDPQIYLYGGVTPSINQSFQYWQWPTTNQYTLWGFHTVSHAWAQYDIFSSVPERPSQGASAEVPDLGLAFYMNGMITKWSSPTTSYLGNNTMFLGGMVVIDLKKQTATNRSTDTITNGRARVRGGMIYVPKLGPNGVLVTVGGATQSFGTLNMVPMNQVNIFDVSTVLGTANNTSDGWYTQTITGTAPESRVDFCLVLASAPDNSSHNIYMYGGWDPTQSNKYFDEVWVLSLPSFTWVEIYNGTAPRFGHSCHTVGNRQMITIGGLDNVNATDYCDWEFMSVAIYDLTDGTVNGWGSIFSVDKPPYQVNAQVSAVIGGGLNGNATKLLPAGGWSTTLIANLFTGTNNQTEPVNVNGLTTSTSPTKSKNIGAIIGGTIGGVATLALLAALALLFVRHYPKFFKKPEGDGQEQYVKAELDTLGKTESDSQPLSEAREPRELPPGIHGVIAEAAGTARSELLGNKLPAEMGVSEIHEKG